MIVFDLKCAHGHVFEAWFASGSSFDDQQKRGLLVCAICGTSAVEKAPMAANIPAKSNQRSAAVPVTDVPVGAGPVATGPVATGPVASGPEPSMADMKAFVEKLATAQKEILKDSAWVGRDFDRQARAMDAGEIDHAPIHGEVSPQEAKALAEDGVKVMPLPLPVIPPEKRN